MITKERLKELINQRATIYKCYTDIVGIYDVYLNNKSMKVTNNHLWIDDKVGIPLDCLFETKEEAEWCLEFGNIQRIETLSLPSWEEFCDCKYSNEFTFFVNRFEYNLFATVRNKEYGEPDTLIIGANDLGMACGYDEIFEKAYTKENYTEACRLAKKLFLGENK